MKKIILMAVLAGILAGCKKNNDKKLTCRMESIHSSATGATTFLTYNDQGKLIQAATGTAISIYSYDAGTTTITNYDTGSFKQRTMVLTNAAGLALNIRTEYDRAGANWSNTFNEYKSEEVIRSMYTSAVSPPDSATFLWSDHNMVGQVRGTDTTKFDYYTDKPRQDGDYLYLTQVLSGYEVYRCKNLFKSFLGAIFTYDRTPDGKISALNIPALNTVYSYEYQCK